ncbi:FKBP-type peptidyl-prolyl cis-trans isomerase [Niabella beijingensis]|uniref:FKBP-type peptidyl-prolyl cis-trans isomerase n=1 Tax=Niabella beijingensis TaxID=2872700 RepID=UPI001CBB8C7B|nr:hypothetical protein [Niabella beijingensis]MBZ4190151.1 hypothetical protein [Niabella beijingensis]
MKKTLFVPMIAVVAVVTVLASCMKDKGPSCVPLTTEQDKHVIDSFIADNGLNLTYKADADYGTFYYIGVTDPGTGSTPTSDSLISFKYTLSLMNGTEIGTSDTIKQKSDGSPIKLSDLKSYELAALSSVRESGKAKVILPSSLYFSCTPQTINGKNVPGNSQLIYEYTLTDVKKPN